MSNRLTKADWLDLGLTVLASDGPAAIRIGGLCARARRTKGSFYHHFKTRDDYVAALMGHWESRLTKNVIARVEREATPVAKLIALNDITMDMEFDLERAVRRWAATDDAVAAAIMRVDARRLDYVASLLMQAKKISSRKAVDFAVMNYAALIGFQHMFGPVDTARRRRIDQVFFDVLTALPDHEKAAR